MPRISIPEAEALIDKEFPCLNQGHVTLKDYLGGQVASVMIPLIRKGVKVADVHLRRERKWTATQQALAIWPEMQKEIEGGPEKCGAAYYKGPNEIYIIRWYFNGDVSLERSK